VRALPLLAAAGGTPADPTLAEELTSPPFLAACVAAVAALAAAGISWASGRRQRQQSDQHREIDFRRAQLNELYGPLVMWREASKRTRELLPYEDANGNEWRLLDHIDEVRGGEHPDWEEAVEQILQISAKVEDLLTSKAGLFESLPAPESYSRFLAHSGRLRMYWEQRKNQPVDKRLPFPGERMDRDIAAELFVIMKRLENLGVKRSV
jgi:hypothetical protein